MLGCTVLVFVVLFVWANMQFFATIHGNGAGGREEFEAPVAVHSDIRMHSGVNKAHIHPELNALGGEGPQEGGEGVEVLRNLPPALRDGERDVIRPSLRRGSGTGKSVPPLITTATSARTPKALSSDSGGSVGAGATSEIRLDQSGSSHTRAGRPANT